MKRVFFAFVLSMLFLSCSKEEEVEEVVVYAYSSFTGEWGAGPKIAKMYEDKYGCKVRFITCKDSGAILANMLTEKDSPKADVVLGIDNYLLNKALRMEVLSSYKPKRYEEIDGQLRMTDDFLLVPFDYGYFAFMYDTTSGVPKPSSLNDLLSSEYKNKIVLMDPTTSAPGLGALMWVYAVYGDSYIDAWKGLTGNALSMPTSWSQGYSLFTSGEVPIVISYTTSLAAHVLYDKTDRFQPLIFKEGHVLQIEGMGILKGSKNLERAKEFVDFMLSDEVQSILPETQFMFPVIKGVDMPNSFKNIPNPENVLQIDCSDIGSIVNDAMNAIK